MATATKARKQTEITSTTVNRVISKATGKVLGYLVKSDSEQGAWYQVTWNREEHRYECTCPATKPCKHERAVSEVVKARKEIEAASQQQAVAEAERQVTSQQVAATVEPIVKAEVPATVKTPVAVATIETPVNVAATTKPAIATKPIATMKAPTVANKANAPLGNNKTFSLMR